MTAERVRRGARDVCERLTLYTRPDGACSHRPAHVSFYRSFGGSLTLDPLEDHFIRHGEVADKVELVAVSLQQLIEQHRLTRLAGEAVEDPVLAVDEHHHAPEK